ncbi:hypothetical protein [Exiguobacterium acetylicum]|uniref:hypothetical protein n=1 Tax=Exiguobacterium acetylicum TaxID=41170 RepID=UPI001CA77E3A|nr:hypothetical protein [Exiguobacterium acetylicum]QZY88648.1 hypothetical protein K7G97_17215 [Exiguobacterium acetylicum]
MKKLQNADEMLRLFPSFLASSAAEGLPIEEDLAEKIKEMLALGIDPTEEIDAYYDKKLKELDS